MHSDLVRGTKETRTKRRDLGRKLDIMASRSGRYRGLDTRNSELS